jgi:hypothetical protein
MNSFFRRIRNSLDAWRGQLQRRFSPSRKLRRTDGLLAVSEGGAGSEWIVARELCAFVALDGSTVPSSKRRAFAQTAARRWSPFADPDFHVEWAGGRAMVWAWSRAGVLDTDDAVAPAPRRLLPESLYRGAPRPHGEEAVAMDHGVEGRVWREHALVASAWWPGPPDLRTWNDFRRGAGLGTDPSVPAPVEAALAGGPWTAAPKVGLGEIASRYRTLLAAACLGIAVAVLGSMLASAVSLMVSIHLVDNEIAEQDEGVQRILLAREQAARDAAEIESLLELRPPAGQVELLAAMVGLLPPGGWQLLEWRMPDPANLQVDLRMAQPDPSALVQSWEASEQFEGVSVELGRTPDEVSIKARVVRRTPATPAASTGPAASAPATGATP